MTESRFLIETLLPLRELSEEARREKAIRHGHISTLHVWWARRPLVVARAAVLGALLTEEAGVDENFIARLCRWRSTTATPPAATSWSKHAPLSASASARPRPGCWTPSPGAAPSPWRPSAWAPRPAPWNITP